MKSRTLVLLALCLALAGCMTAGQRAQRDDERCTARGLQPNSDKFKECLLEMESARELRRDTRHREMMERSANPLPR